MFNVLTPTKTFKANFPFLCIKDVHHISDRANFAQYFAKHKNEFTGAKLKQTSLHTSQGWTERKTY